ncbi:(11Z)-hexadec-11-enoyl-CoA conjugase [Neodiprion lecontei]|uniref:(11Z)-hexadec-11-enoyl-CoA conjugase n=1 Tax=Neodiprion lecontei TaxID=441921 RepID=A0A6J0C8V4_NEOLC|nr:(11Z)-hexadec-11-enoyl-CoA conjugase [Neodiprion lecontei]XP_046590161.1 (11Z)-hexadec-11-enoyl-CoA conjugase [Neodiprion lecontei]XP_046590162.1 (11Z)-hexadec-11-enoyl-CoA conjugase [Neodiprion lecontei]
MRGHDLDLNFIVKNDKSQEFDLEEVINKDVSTNDKFYHRLVIPNLLYFGALHVGAVIGIYHLLVNAKVLTIIWAFLMAFCTGEAVTLGAHRYYSHKSFKATTALRLAMIIFQTAAGQNSMYTWARDHRLHHKYSDTDADPHNATRGFFFSHVGWLISKKHPLVKEKSKCIDVSDLLDDKILMFQHKYFVPVYLLVGFLCPTCLPVFCWDENWWTSFYVVYCLRYVGILHATWSVNSIAHMFGTKPYDKRIVSVDSNVVSFLTGGDGWHNYHHSFPWDWRAGEFSVRGGFNTKFLQRLADYGFAYDLKTASDSVVEGHTKKHGDGTRPVVDVGLNEHEDKKPRNGVVRNAPKEKSLVAD